MTAIWHLTSCCDQQRRGRCISAVQSDCRAERLKQKWHVSPAFLWQQRYAWWTAVPTDPASVVCVSARKAGQDQNVSRGTVTHAASTTASAERASVTAIRAGRANTAPSVSTPTEGWMSRHVGDECLRFACLAPGNQGFQLCDGIFVCLSLSEFFFCRFFGFNLF